MPTTVIPCKTPRVTIEPSNVGGGGLYDHVCHVPGCGWTYRSVKSDHLGAPHHRREHRDAVPTTETKPRADGDGFNATCDCGAAWIAPTRAHAKTWLRHHLELDHGLVVC